MQVQQPSVAHRGGLTMENRLPRREDSRCDLPFVSRVSLLLRRTPQQHSTRPMLPRQLQRRSQDVGSAGVPNSEDVG